MLSGGERNRLMLARALAQPSNLLVLDEPTNDLDLETLDLLQEMLADYAGTVLLVSHDRDFLDRTVGSVLMAEGRGAGSSTRAATATWSPSAARACRRGRTAAPGRREGGRSAPSGATRRPPRRSSSASSASTSSTTSRRLPERIAALEAKVAELQRVLADPALYARDRARFDRASAALSEAQGELAAAEDRWLELEVLREELEG